MFKKIVVATDSSDHADKAVAVAADLAAKYDADLTLVHVLLRRDSDISDFRELIDVQSLSDKVREEFDRYDALQQQRKKSTSGVGISVAIPVPEEVLVAVGNTIVGKAEKIARDHGATKIDSIMAEGDPADIIVNCAKNQSADLIVLGTRGLGGLQGMFVGSVSHKVSQLADCTCITVR
jgi:nucleotide-binding universal stress UspA family protein